MVGGVTNGEPLEYVYVAAPLGKIVNVEPVHIVPLFTSIVGIAFTVTALTAVAVQPAALVPVTV